MDEEYIDPTIDDDMLECLYCLKSISEDEAHYCHDDDCPNYGKPATWGCDCDNMYCENCCPMCHTNGDEENE